METQSVHSCVFFFFLLLQKISLMFCANTSGKPTLWHFHFHITTGTQWFKTSGWPLPNPPGAPLYLRVSRLEAQLKTTVVHLKWKFLPNGFCHFGSFFLHVRDFCRIHFSHQFGLTLCYKNVRNSSVDSWASVTWCTTDGNSTTIQDTVPSITFLHQGEADVKTRTNLIFRPFYSSHF